MPFVGGSVLSGVGSSGGGGGSGGAAFDGATFTPGTFNADSGQRTVTVELTSGGAAITTGTLYVPVLLSRDVNWNAYTTFVTESIGYGANCQQVMIPNAPINLYVQALVIPAADGHVQVDISVPNANPDAVNCYVSVILPSGAVVSSAAISIPGVGGGWMP